MKIYELRVDDDILEDTTLDGLVDYTSVSEIALVENPAIETEWVYFSKEKFESYNDYPRAASDAACRAVRYAEENGWGRCGTNVGKKRAHQLCNREKISIETIARMASFERHRRHKDVPYDEGCGGLMWDSWGSESGIKWAQRKLRLLERQQDFITPNPCQSGYEPYGHKIKDGRKVPNCVPLSEERFEAVVDIDGLPLYKTQSEAETIASMMGCEGSHPHEYEGETLYMPCKSMEDTKKLWDESSTERLCESCEIVDTSKGIELEEILNDGYVISDVKELDEEETLKILEDYKNKVNGKYSREEFYNIVADPNKPSIQDGFGKKVRYIYVVGTSGAPLISTSREFCRNMIGKKQLVFRFEDIQALNAQLTAEDTDRKILPRPKGTSPNIFLYKGHANCRHKFVQLWFNEDERIPARQTRAVSKAEVETNAPGRSGQAEIVVAKVQNSKEERPEDMPIFYEYGLPVYEEKTMAEWKSEMMGCQGEIDMIDRDGKTYYRTCKYKEKKEEFKEQFEFKKDDEKRMIYSPAMIPDRLIRRFDGRDEYWVFFTKETIEKIAHKFLMEKRVNYTNLEHTDKKFDDIYMVESWIVSSENDKAYSLGYTKKEVPMGSWMVGYKVKNDDVWENQIKTGKVKGLSVEGEFELITQSFSNDEYLYNEIINILKNTK